ncbi:MAG TPA: flagellar basal-body MS-ring/collar protein FliF [Beijerinckiaceae bacterium]|nr:flagellar basal-body MS-ring/collar protein FliF [Beijerinckiaceae bacterium]
MQGLIDFVQKLGPQRLVAMGAVTLALAAFFGFIAFRVAQQPAGILYADLAATESAAIARELDTRGIRYELRNDGATIAVPRDLIPRLRMDLAAKGIPAGGSVGYEIFDKGDAFSATGFMQNLNQVRALEGELARSIRALERIQAARVHLVLPERRLFQKDRSEARASVVLRVRGELEAGQVRAVRHLVASAVDGLKPARVSLIDEAGRLLADGAGDETPGGVAAEERQQGFERRLRGQIEDIVASVVGRSRARVQVSAEFEHNRVQQTSETYDPESRVIRSTQSRTESNATTEGKDGQVSIGNELPGAQKPDGAAGAREQGQKQEETVNYEISRTTRTETLEAGRLKRLSVAVLVDGVHAKGANGEATYTPRPAEELQRIAALVRIGIGFDKARGDQVEVVNLRFAETPPPLEVREPTLLERLQMLARDEMLRIAEIGVFAVLSLVALIFIVRPLVRQMLAPAEPVAPPGVPTVRPADGTTVSGAEAPGMATGLPPPNAIERLGERIASQPQEAAAILKTWIRSAA